MALQQSPSLSVLTDLRRIRGHGFWPESVSYADVNLSGVRGHRQVTDPYLVALAIADAGRVATFDRGARRDASIRHHAARSG